ncbi:MAG: ABC transporter permease [Flavobacteriales bacterium]|nr:ABC transporter permease [Flavobacteriales bacterium]PIV92347.1 MAG: ABC transporter permease [Flavobacteriaceae bacterium CG17_big_fil_post_rev_8_21_14_2_50_33_15]PIY09730.1 MAG: ABC transporter permease [Flavobacteriaceae bacterium CG_4_10_14_3_um_filter_33_47]PJB20597.1 MAG: ABC transporter permease [Flavobacteriaceae bacterium CG_4_9_14_3_um_filter_33_16]NCP52370.1 ABC transporter permease [Flavobacteriales bacterium]
MLICNLNFNRITRLNTLLEDTDWLYTISAKKRAIHLNFKEIWRYRDLLLLFVKRDVVTLYKQTILGPLWYFIQPLFTSVIFTLVFNNIANIETGEGVPSFLFNLAGITSWNYFSACLNGTSDTFKQNQGIFGKVYFPRVIMPISTVLSNLIKFGIQLLVFICFYLYFVFFTEAASQTSIQSNILMLPLVIVIMALLGLGFGMIISSMTTKYRDLSFLVSFGVQLLMYGSAVMYPLSLIQEKVSSGMLPNWVGSFIEYNPMTTVIELFRHMVLGVGDFSISKLMYATVFSVVLFLLGLIVFNRTERRFIDTV